MPYVLQKIRDELSLIGELSVNDAGELNYCITTLIVNYLGMVPKYADFNEAIGVLECAKLELYRRMVAPYEDTKCAENGDVYPS